MIIFDVFLTTTWSAHSKNKSVSTLNRNLLLKVLIKHETLTLPDIADERNLGLTPNPHHLKFLLDELEESFFIKKLNGVEPPTYTITDVGIVEGQRLELQSEWSPIASQVVYSI